MPYTVALPDGRTVEFPDDIPPDSAAEILRKQFPTPDAPSNMGDLLASFGRGAAGSSKALTDVFGANNAASNALEDVSKGLEARMSPERRAELQRQAARSKKAAESGSLWEEIKAAGKNIAEAPLQSAAEGLGSFVPYLPALLAGPAGAALGLGARSVAALETVANVAPKIIGTAQGFGAVKGSIYDAVYEAERKDGTSEEEAKAKASKAQEYFGKNFEQIALGGGLGLLASSTGVETLFTKEGVRKAAPGMARRVATAVAEEVPTEFLQGGQEALAGNLALQREGRDTPTWQGVLGQATQEGLTAALSAAPVAMVRSPSNYLAEQEREKRAAEQAAALQQAQEDAAKQTAFRQTPEYLDDLEARFRDFRAQEQELALAAKAKIDKNDPLAVEEKRRAQEAYDEFKNAPLYTQLMQEYTEAFDALKPRIEERKRQARVEAAPENTQLNLAGLPGGINDESLPGQIKSLEKFASSFDKQIDQAKKAGDTNQLALLQQKQAEARDQIAALLPDADTLAEARVRAEKRLEEYQAKIQALTTASNEAADAPNRNATQIAEWEQRVASLQKLLENAPQQAALAGPNARARVQQQIESRIGQDIASAQKQVEALRSPQGPSFDEIRQLSDVASQIRAAIAEIDSTQKAVEKYRPAADTVKPGDTEKQLAALRTKLQNKADLGEDVGGVLKQIDALQNAPLSEQPDLFGAEELKPVKPRGLEDIMAEGRDQAAALREKLDQERKALQQMASTTTTERGEDVQRRKEELVESARKTAEAMRNQNETLAAMQRLKTLLEQDGALLTQMQAKGVAVPEWLPKRMATVRRDIESMALRLEANKPERAEPQKQLAEFGPNEERPVTDEELMAQRDRDIDALLEKYLPPALGVEQTREQLELDSPEAAALRDLEAQIETLRAEGKEVPAEMQSQLREMQAQIQPQQLDLISLGGEKFNKGTLRKQLEEVQIRRDNATDALFEASGAEANRLRNEIANLALREVELRRELDGLEPLSAEYRQDLRQLVQDAFKPLREAPQIVSMSLDDRIDGLVAEFSEGTPKITEAQQRVIRRVSGQRPAALEGVDLLEKLRENRARLKELNQDIQYAGRPSDEAKLAALNALKEERTRLKAEQADLQKRYNAKQAAPQAVPETGEVAEMRTELAKIEQALASGSFAGNTRVVASMEAARDELKGKIESATGPQPRAAAERPTLPAVSQRASQFEYKPVSQADIYKARTAQVAASQKVEDIRAALTRLDEMGPQYFQEVATTSQLKLEKEKAELKRMEGAIKRIEKSLDLGRTAMKDAPADRRNTTPFTIKTEQGVISGPFTLAQLEQDLKNAQAELAAGERRAETLSNTEKEVVKFLNLARLAGNIKSADIRAKLEEALANAQTDIDVKKAAVADLEKRQRMYEQQEAAKRGVDLGEIEAEKITAGKTQGYVNINSKRLSERPRNRRLSNGQVLRSWIVSRDSTAKVPKPAEAGKLEAATQNAMALLAEAKQGTAAAKAALETSPSPQEIERIKGLLTLVQAQIDAHYNTAQAAEISKEITLLQQQLADLPGSPKASDVTAAYRKATSATKGLPAHERVAQMMFKASVAENKAAAGIKAAEQKVTEAQQKYDTAVASAKKAEKKLAKAKTPATARGLQLHIDNVLGTVSGLRDAVLDATQNRTKAEQVYMAARLERLLLVQQMGEHARTEAANLTARLTGATETIAALETERDAALEREEKIRSKLTAAEAAAEKTEADAEAARNYERNAAKIAEDNARRAALDAAKKAREDAEAARSGRGLDYTRVERDTAGILMTAVQADIKQKLATAETMLSKAIANGDTAAITKATADVRKYTKELDEVYGKAPVKVTSSAGTPTAELDKVRTRLAKAKADLQTAQAANDAAKIDKLTTDVESLTELEGIYAREAAEATGTPKPVAGVRSTLRREGPTVRNVRGGKAVMQAGVVKLRAAGLSQEAANAISFYVKKNQIKGSKTADTKAKRTAEFEEMSRGMTAEQVDALVAEGQRLSGLGPTAELIAKRVALRDAMDARNAAEEKARKAKSALEKDLAEDELLLAEQRQESADRAYNQAKDLYEMSMVKTANKATKATIEALLADVDTDVKGSKTASAVGNVYNDEFGTTYANTSYNFVNEATQDLLQDGQLGAALDRIAKEGSNDLLRRNAENLRKLVFKTKVVFKPNLTLNGESVPALYSAADNTVYLNADSDVTQEDVVHESTHAATLYALSQPIDSLTKEQQMARNELVAMWRMLQRDAALADQYGLKNIAEFASEMQSNQAFRDAIGDRKWRGESFLRRAFNLLLELIGFRRAELLTDKAEQYINALYMQSRAFTGANVAGAAARNSVLVADDPARYGTFKDNVLGLAGRVQYVDRLGAADEAFVKAQKSGNLSSLEAETAQYFMRLADNVAQAAGQFITSGPVALVKDKLGGNVEERYESRSGVNLVNIASAIEGAAKAGLGTPQEIETMATVLVAGDRANATPSGWQRLAGSKAAEAKLEYEAYKRRLDANPEAKKYVEQAKAEYKAYNDGLIDFVEQTGYLSKQDATALRSKPYVPFYRVVKDEVRLYVDSAQWVRIGDLKSNPDLKQMLGSEDKIQPLLTSAVQNTFMLTRAALHNKGTHETASALFKAGFASKFGPGTGPDSPDVVRFKVKGQDYFAMIDSDAFGIPAELIVRGMEGMKVATPEIVKLLGIPANWVRKFVTRGPAYIFRQLVREPIQAAIMQGVDGTPVLNALKQMAKMRAGRSPAEEALMRGLVVSSNIYTGDEQDMQMFLRDVSTGRGNWDKLLGKLDAVALQADAATRAVIYEDSIKKGLTPRQAQFRALESQNFSRRGLSPSMQMARVMVPFFNAQIQGLDVLYRAMRGRLPFEEKLKLRDKMIKRGLLLATTALGYAMLMREDEKYKEQSPDVRYGNFLFKLPGGKDYLKVPIPYELGIIFKALPEAMLDLAMNDTKAAEAAGGIGKLIWQSAPGVVPVAVKPWVEAALNQTAYGPVEDARMAQLPAEQRSREETPEVLKALGSFTGSIGVSPRMLEHFANAYGSSLLLSLLRIPDGLLRNPSEGEKASLPISKTAFLGGMFQSEDGRFAIDRAYAEMEKINEAVKGYEDLAKRGRRAEADAFAQRMAKQLDLGSAAGAFKERMGEMFEAERAIRLDSGMTKVQKDAMIKEIKANQQREAKEFYASVQASKTTPQPAR